MLPPPNVLPPQPAMPLPASDDHARDGPPAGVGEADTEGYFSHSESVTKRKAMLPLKLSRLQRPLRI